MASLTLTGLQKSFGATRVLNHVDLHVHDGEFLTLVGPSGCGKTTLLRIIAGLDHADQGEVHIGDAKSIRWRQNNVMLRWSFRVMRYIRT